jgi:hypothetical protein
MRFWAKLPALHERNRKSRMRINDRTGRGRAVDTESQFVTSGKIRTITDVTYRFNRNTPMRNR